MHPSTHIALRDDLGAGIDEHAVTADMIQMVMRVDDKLHRQACDLADLGKNLLRRLQAERTGRIDSDEAIDDNDAVITYDEAGIAQASRFDNRPYIAPHIFQGKQRNIALLLT